MDLFDEEDSLQTSSNQFLSVGGVKVSSPPHGTYFGPKCQTATQPIAVLSRFSSGVWKVVAVSIGSFQCASKKPLEVRQADLWSSRGDNRIGRTCGWRPSAMCHEIDLYIMGGIAARDDLQVLCRAGRGDGALTNAQVKVEHAVT